MSSEEIALAAADLATVAALRAALEVERAKRRTIERAVRAWVDDWGHSPQSCDTCAALYAIAQGTHADPLLAELDAARAVLRDTIYRIEAVLEDAALDDGMVSVGALMRLDEHYFTILKPLRG